jgi:TRAP-type transport system periplasmic protein
MRMTAAGGRRMRGAATATRAAVLATTVVLAGRAATADPVTLRIASVAPEGTAWAREMRAFGREVAAATHDEVQVKWYFSGIAGDELQSHARVRREQLDGVISGGMLCQRLAPSMRAAHMAGEFRDQDEVAYVIGRMKPILDREFAKEGYVNVVEAGLGFSIFFSRAPVRTMADLRTQRSWLWSLDEVMRTQLVAMGVNIVPLPVETSARAYDEHRVDAFIAMPMAALAFQWSAQTRYVIDLRVGYLTACLLISHKAWDALGHEEQQQITSAAAKLQQRIESGARESNDLLLGGLFAKQGLTRTPVSPALQAEFAAAALRARQPVEKLMPPGIMERVAGWIAEYRSQHHRGGEKR